MTTCGASRTRSSPQCIDKHRLGKTDNGQIRDIKVYTDMIWTIVEWTFLVLGFAGTIRIVFYRFDLLRWASAHIASFAIKEPAIEFLRFVTHPNWGVFAIVILSLPMAGFYARGEISPIPWQAFQHDYYGRDHGLLHGIYGAGLVLIVDLWAFVGVAQYNLMRKQDKWEDFEETIDWHQMTESQQWSERSLWKQKLETKSKYWLTINVITGLLLVPKGNAVYQMIGWVFGFS